MANRNQIKEITTKTIKPKHLHTCEVCKSDDVTVTSKHLLRSCPGNGIARCENCGSIQEF